VKIGVISDTHLKAVDEHFRVLMERYFSDVSTVIHAGDIVDVSVYEYLSRWRVVAVSGNMDGRAIRDLLPSKTVAELGTRRIGIMHGWGSPAGLSSRVREEFGAESVDCIVFGHSHCPYNRPEKGVLLFNPGSLTDGRSEQRNTLGYLTITEKGIEGEIKEA
jgi:hypothetical protein